MGLRAFAEILLVLTIITPQYLQSASSDSQMTGHWTIFEPLIDIDSIVTDLSSLPGGHLVINVPVPRSIFGWPRILSSR
jgi:hypothetical protein